MTTEIKQGMTKTEFKEVCVAKSIAHAFYQAMRQGVTRAQAELWAIQEGKANPRMIQLICKAE